MMSRLTKTMLVLLILNTAAAALFLSGVVDVSRVPGLYLTFPLAAIFYGLFLICWMLDREVTAFDAEQHAGRSHPGPDIEPHNVEPLPRAEHQKSIAA
jgi:hypothetical protein